jgi:predicted RNA-binding protein with PUA-like domain
MSSSYWLLKSEGDCYSIDDLKRDGTTSWTGIRNYQARNYMRDQMKAGDMCLFYHSSSEPTGIYGIAKVARGPHPDETALDKKDDHFDPKATKDNPIWMCVDIRFVKKLKRPIPLSQLRADPHLRGMLLLQPGSRLSVQPVSKQHFDYITKELAQ